MMSKINIQYHKTQIGEFILGSINDELCLLDYKYRKMRVAVDSRIQKAMNTEFIEASNDLLQETKIQVDDYLNGDRLSFDLPLITIGTEFQKKVWSELLKIPYGVTVSYQQLANNIGNEKAVRAVASANGANAMAIIIPCHRIIGSNNELVGYAGGLPAKKTLLNLEKSNKN